MITDTLPQVANRWPQVFIKMPNNPELEMEILRAQYRMLSEFHIKGSSHRLLRNVEPMMDYCLSRLQELSNAKTQLS